MEHIRVILGKHTLWITLLDKPVGYDKFTSKGGEGRGERNT